MKKKDLFCALVEKVLLPSNNKKKNPQSLIADKWSRIFVLKVKIFFFLIFVF